MVRSFGNKLAVTDLLLPAIREKNQQFSFQSDIFIRDGSRTLYFGCWGSISVSFEFLWQIYATTKRIL